jgi:D-glycero-alpha-D-manno-heptose-7-phosphate kinase
MAGPKTSCGKIMIIVRTPLRISLFGGGTDIDPYMSMFGGKVLSFAIDKYIYLSAHPLVESNDIMLKYSVLEKVANPLQIQHKVFRVILQKYAIQGIDIAVSSDIPTGTGLGSSSSFTVGLLQLIEGYLGRSLTKHNLAADACRIELDELKEPIGIQDQYAATFGGINILSFNSRNDVVVKPIAVQENILRIIEKNLLLVRVAGNRSASNLLKTQIANMEKNETIVTLNEMKSLVDEGLNALQKSEIEFGKLLGRTWSLKKKLSPEISNRAVDILYEELLQRGFYGGKLLGAGANGYLLMVGSQSLVENTHLSADFSTQQVGLDYEGSKIIYTS